jgi:hypothetical protein
LSEDAGREVEIWILALNGAKTNSSEERLLVIPLTNLNEPAA